MNEHGKPSPYSKAQVREAAGGALNMDNVVFVVKPGEFFDPEYLDKNKSPAAKFYVRNESRRRGKLELRVQYEAELANTKADVEARGRLKASAEHTVVFDDGYVDAAVLGDEAVPFLRAYQHSAVVRALQQMWRGESLLLCSAPGMGKTRMSLAAARAKSMDGKARFSGEAARTVLVVAPPTLLPQWKAEIRAIHGEAEVLDGLTNKKVEGLNLEQWDYVLVSSAFVAKQTCAVAAALMAATFSTVIIDEIHMARSRNKTPFKGLVALVAAQRKRAAAGTFMCLGLTGTPIVNVVEDLHSEVCIVQAGVEDKQVVRAGESVSESGITVKTADLKASKVGVPEPGA